MTGISLPDFTGHDLGTDPLTIWVVKQPVPVQVRFALGDGVLGTAEGPVSYLKGDALLSGEAGDRWPVSRASFDAWYEPERPSSGGNDGVYRKRPQPVRARRMDQAFQVRVGYANDPIQGRPGDWLLMYAPGEYGVVGAEQFSRTYRLIGA